MDSNGYDNSGSSVFVLYKVVNSDADNGDFNAFQMPRGSRGPTLATVKQNCAALHGLNHLGPEGYHWRVCVEDKPAAGEVGPEKAYSWWDIQDDNAVLPVKTASQYQLYKFFAPPKDEGLSETAKVAKGAFKSFGKAVSNAVVGHDDSDTGPPVTVIAFKLLDMVKMHDDFSHKNHGRGGHIPQPAAARSPAAAPPQAQSRTAPRPTPPPPVRPPAQAQSYTRAQPAPPPRAAVSQSVTIPPRPSQEASLMDFGGSSAPSSRKLHHATSSPSSFNADETRAERLKREYEQKHQTANRVWDEVDQRWVDVDPNATGNVRATQSAPPGANATNESNKKKEVGMSLDPTNAAGKAAHVQAAVQQRVSDMKQSQAKALQEVREREEKKKREDAEEEIVRKKLEPRIKAWSEEHGKKKQLRALLATLHSILWPGANWQQVSIGDLLDDSKVKRCFHKASRVVHPDKTHHLGPEERFLAKRIFDALSQAKAEFDSTAK